jgi:hypothetical protein
MARRNPTESLFVPVVSPENLEKAAQLRRQIDALEAEYRRLLSPGTGFGEQSGPTKLSEGGRRQGRPVGPAPLPITPSEPKDMPDAGNAVSKRPRGSSRAPSVRELNHMSLREAVVRALQTAGGPQTIDGILRKLRMLHYRFHEGTDPIRFLSERIYNLAGVKAIGAGHFDLVERLGARSTTMTDTAVAAGKVTDLTTAVQPNSGKRDL